METNKGYDLTRVKNDVNGNPRYIIHFLAFLRDNDEGSLESRYIIAMNRARKLGGKKYRAKHYGGGIVFQCYNTNGLIADINAMVD